MRLLLVTGHFSRRWWSPDGALTLNTAAALAERRHAVSLLAVPGANGRETANGQEPSRAAIEVLHRSVLRSKPELVLVCSVASPQLMQVCGRACLEVPAAALLLDNAHMAAEPDLRLLDERGTRFACTSLWQKKRLSSILSGPGSSSLVRLGIETGLYPCKDRPGSIHRPVRILCRSLPGREPGIAALDEAVGLIEETAGPGGIELTFLAGDGPPRPLSLEAGQRGNPSLRFAHSLSEQNLAGTFRAHDIFVCVEPGHGPLGLDHLRAMASGVPLITAGSYGYNELVQDGVSGYLVDGARPKQLANRISRLRNDEHLARRMAETALQRIRGSFTWEHYLDRLETFLNQCLASADA